MVKLLSRRSFAVISAILLAFLAAGVYAASFRPSIVDPDCTVAPPAGIEAELEVVIDNRVSVEPRATVAMLVDLPVNDGLARDLLHHTRDDELHKQALRCLLGMPGLVWNGQSPSVTKEGDRTLVRARTSEAVSLLADGLAQVGLLEIHTVSPMQWQATITEPAYLALAKWREVSVTAPAGWLSGSQPDISAQLIRWERPASDGPGAATERIRWERPARDTESVTATLAGFTVHPDTRTRIASASRTSSWIWASDLLYSLSALLLVGALVLWAHKDRAVVVRRMCVPILVVSGAAIVGLLAVDYELTVWLLPTVLPALVLLGVAAAWGVPRLAWLPVGLEVLLLNALSLTTSETVRPAAVAQLEVAAWTFLAFQLIVVLAVGLINAARVLLSPRPQLAPPGWVWWCGAACAAALVLERFANNSPFVNSWVSNQVLDTSSATLAMMTYPWEVLYSIELVLPVLAVLGAWALIRQRLAKEEPVADKELDKYVVLLFLLGPAVWDVGPFGLWLPVWPLSLLVLWLWLRDPHDLLDTRLARPGSTVRSVVMSHTDDELRAAAAQWGRIRQRGRALDRDLAKGTITLDTHDEETRKLLDIRPLPHGNAGTVRELRAGGVTPVDMALALGPGRTPWDNAKKGVQIAALAGIPAVGLDLWLLWHTRPPGQTGMAILDWIGMVAWEIVTWLAAGALLGLLWQRLRFARGIGKALPLVTAYAAAQLAAYATDELTGGNSTALFDIALFTVVITVTALFMDMSALRTTDTWWSRRRHALAAAYGMENLSAQVAFVATQAVAVITIITLIHDGIADQPAAPTGPPERGQTRSSGAVADDALWVAFPEGAGPEQGWRGMTVRIPHA